jgi:hypothetical protein
MSWVFLGALTLCVLFGLLLISRDRIPIGLSWIRKIIQPRRAVAIGVVFGFLFLFVTVIFYPYERPILWRIIRFGLISALLVLAIMTIPLIVNHIAQDFIVGFTVIWSVLIVITFIGSTGISFIQGTLAFFTVFSHRHFPYLIITLTIIGSLGLGFWLFSNRQRPRQKTRVQKKTSSILLYTIIAFLLISGAVNLYVPVGGWHQPWCSENEIQGGDWLVNYRGTPSVTISDGRLGVLVQGLVPNIPSSNIIEPISPDLIQNPPSLTNSVKGYFFISTRLETEYMVSERIGLVIFVFFTIPPTTLSSRIYLDNNTIVNRVYSNFEVTIYSF